MGVRAYILGRHSLYIMSLNKMQVRRFLPVLSDAMWPRFSGLLLVYMEVLHVAKKP